MFRKLIVKSIGNEVTTTEIELDFWVDNIPELLEGIINNGLYIETTYGTFIKGESKRKQIITKNKYIFPKDIISVEVTQ